MIVRPDEISANSAPRTSPLKHCEIKLAQLITRPPAIVSRCLSAGRCPFPSGLYVFLLYHTKHGGRAFHGTPAMAAREGLPRITDAEKAFVDIRCSRRVCSRKRRAFASAEPPAQHRGLPRSLPCSSSALATCRAR